VNTFRLGMKNAFRNVVRTTSVVLILGISFGLALVMLLSLNAVKSHIKDVSSSINNTITVTPAGSFGGFGGGGNPFSAKQLAEIKSVAHVTKVTSTISDRLSNTASSSTSAPGGNGFGGGGGSGGTTSLVSPITPGTIAKTIGGAGPTLPSGFTLPTQIYGTNDPSNPATLNATKFKLTAGSLIPANSSALVADVGTTLATKNKLVVGSTFSAYKKTFKVVGIFDVGTVTGNAAIIVPLKTEATLSSTNGPTSVVVKVDSIANVATTSSAIQAKLGKSVANVTSSESNAQTVVDSFSSIKTISLYSLIGALIGGAVILFLSMLMIVRERRREIGILKAFGSSNRNVVSLFVTESLTLTVLAGLVGSLVWVALANPVLGVLQSSTSTTSSGGGRPPTGFGGGGFVPRFGAIASDLHAAIGWNVLLYAIGGILVIALVGSAIPAYAIAKVRPAEVLRGE